MMHLEAGDRAGLIRMDGPFRAWTTTLLLLLAVALIDGFTTWEFGFSAFYLLPVIWLAWSRGTRQGVLLALMAGGTWYGVDVLSGRPLSSEFFRFWDACNHLGSYLLAAWVVGALRREIMAQQALNARLQETMDQVRELKGLLPVCAWCHKIRDDEGQWHPMEVYLSSRTKASPTHGICPSCAANLHQEAGAP
jgi:hypothetical protein